MGEYSHKPLASESSIRLLVLYPASNPAAALHGSLYESDLSGALPYEALSYEWGSKQGTEPFRCGDSEQLLFITPNCDSALRQLRHTSCKRRLWVDSVCINQRSVLERNHQVQLMDRIFGQAKSVLIWLGPADGCTPHVFRVIGQLAAVENRQTRYGLVKSTSPALWAAMLELCSRGWHERAWTMQELMLAHEALVLCGEHKMKWEPFALGTDIALSYYAHAFPSMAEPYRGLCHRFWYWEAIHDTEKRPSKIERLVANVLLASRTQKCEDPKDKVYALHSVVKTLGLSLPAPDYSDELPLARLYEQTTLQYITQYRSLYIVEMSPRSHEDQYILPTWSTDFRRSGYSSILRPLRFRGRPPRELVDLDLLKTREARSLLLRGRHLDRADRVCRAAPAIKPARSDSFLICAKFLSWVEFTSSLPRLSADENDLDHLASILNLPRGIDGWTPEFLTHCEALRDSMEDELGELDSYKKSAKEAFQSMAANPPDRRDSFISSAAALYLLHQTIFFTQNGRLGRGTETVREGDIVVLLAGASVPTVLRPYTGDSYLFVGPAEIGGLSEEDWELGDVKDLDCFKIF